MAKSASAKVVELNSVEAELAALRAENDRLKAKVSRATTVSFKISEKGAVSVYGLGRFPVTLYQEQWDRLDASYGDLRKFIDANRSKLSKKK